MYIYSKKKRFINLIFLVLDLICICISFCTSYFIRNGTFILSSSGIYTQILLIMLFTYICAVYLFETYVDIEKRGYFKEFISVIKVNIALMFMLLFFAYLTKQSDEYSRSVFVGFFTINITLSYLYKILFKKYLIQWQLSSDGRQTLLLVTDYNQASAFIEKISSVKYDYKIIGLVLLDRDMIGDSIGGIPVIANRNTIFDYAKLAVIDEALISLQGQVEYTAEISEVLIDMGITVHVDADDLIKLDVPNRKMHQMGDISVISGSMKMASTYQAIAKRMMDIIGSIFGLIITGIVTIFIAPAIIIESPGPVFFKQERIGKNGRRFKIVKFRSMYMDAEEKKKELLSKNKMKGHIFKIDDDPRITKVGRFIRKTSIDELPQFWNVLKGDMSLVGTRPPTVDEYEQYELRHKKRLCIKPGITGMWQVNGRSNVVDFEEIVKLDTKYINDWSIGLDCRLLLKTVRVLFGDKNAS